MSVQLPCSLRILCTEVVRSPCGDRPSHGARAGIVQCHLRHVYGLRAYNFFQICKTWLSQIVEATEPVNPYKNLTAASCLRREASGMLYGKGDTGSVDPSQAKCELGIMYKNSCSTIQRHPTQVQHKSPSVFLRTKDVLAVELPANILPPAPNMDKFKNCVTFHLISMLYELILYMLTYLCNYFLDGI